MMAYCYALLCFLCVGGLKKCSIDNQTLNGASQVKRNRSGRRSLPKTVFTNRRNNSRLLNNYNLFIMLQRMCYKAWLPAAMLFLKAVCFGQSGTLKIDHSYRPPWWQTLVCLPDDPVKTLVGKEGQIFGDFNYPGPRHFSFALQFDSKTPATWKSQELQSAIVPLTHTIKDAAGVQVDEKTFLQIPGEQALNSIERYDSRRIETGWSKPQAPCDSAFYDVAYGMKGLSGEGVIDLHVKVKPGASFNAALGFCEGKYDTAGVRTMRVFVEGSEQKDIDPVKDFGVHTPGVYFLNAKDVNGDGIINIVVSNKPGAMDRDAFLNGLWLFNKTAPSAASIIAGKENKTAAIYARCAYIRMPERRYQMLVTLKNTTGSNQTFSPVLKYNGIEPIAKQNSVIRIGDETVLTSSNSIDSLSNDSINKYTVNLHPVMLKAGEQKQVVVSVSRFFDPKNSYQPTVASATKDMTTAIAWWQKNCPSATAISVPDSGVQAIVESSLRNIFQARDIRKGNKSFHVGPTEYRGLWLADGTYLLEVATMLGYTKDVRSCIDYLTHFQLPGGGFEMITTFHKENGLVPIMLIRHAVLTQDKKWLNDNWSVIEGCLRRIQYLRDSAMKDPSKPYYTLLPDGNIDGGIQHGNDYSNTEYCLAGMKWAINAAKWLGKNDQAAKWQNDYDDFYGKFMAKATKDIRKDSVGNPYLPVMINNEQNQLPQRGQWAFCQSVYPGQVFDTDTTAHRIAKETVDMLGDHKVEGLVYTTGWMDGGLWTYFTSFYAHALQWLGEGSEVPQLLYDFGNHSSPTMVWREEQKPQGKGNDEVGDMPHNWASAEFIRMVVHMIQLDHGKDLHLFESFPKQWARANAVTKLNGISTPFGKINLSFAVNGSGDAAKLHLQFLDNVALPQNVMIYKKSWADNNDVQTLKPLKTMDVMVPFH